jgi:hypothetical protein
MIPLSRRAQRLARYPLFVLIAGIVASCHGETTGPGGGTNGPPGVNIVAGANVTDTVDAAPPLALRVVVRDDDGHVVRGAVVRFSSVLISRPGQYVVPSVLLGDLSSQGVSSFVAETTSAEGVALARIVMGNAAGAAGVVVSVPLLGAQDTAHFTVTPGAAVKVVLPIADTTIQVTRSLPLKGRVEDRHANPRADAVTYETSGTGLTVAGGQVSAAAPARAAVIGRVAGAGIAPDTTWVSVVPAATIAAPRAGKLMIASLDGTGVTAVPHTLEIAGPGPEWHPDGQSLLALLGTFGSGSSLYRVLPSGATQLVTGQAAAQADGHAVPGGMTDYAYSPDGQWVYVSGGVCNYAAILYRFPVTNPAGIERLSGYGLDECFELVNHWPSPSPDGARLAYENQTWNQSGYSVRVMDLATKQVTQLVAGGQRPRWAPAGDLIAYWLDKQIWVVRPDGTGVRVVSPPGHSYVPGVQWSPDGQWILARFEPSQGWAGTTVALLNVATGLEIPLTWTTGYGGVGLPSWKPVP